MLEDLRSERSVWELKEIITPELRLRARGTRVKEARVKELWAVELRYKESISAKLGSDDIELQ